MKAKTCFMMILVALLAVPVFAQGNAADQLELTRTYIEANRQTIVTTVMNLTEEESKTFWPIYKEYRANVQKVNDRLIKLIEDYANSYENLTDEKSADLMIRNLDIEEDRLLYKRIYIELFLEALSPSKVARFFQIENKMDSVIRADLAVAIPLMAPKTQVLAELDS